MLRDPSSAESCFMIRTVRLAAGVSLALVLAACSAMPAHHLAQATGKSSSAKGATAAPAEKPQMGWGPGPVVPQHRYDVWPQTYSDLTVDPNVRFGTLPNGMRYALMRNNTPSGQVSMRLRINGGSLMEKDEQQGLAHFLEHMAFEGSKNVPNGELIKTLERLGLSFGADTNAQTEETQTIFQFDLPKNDDNTVDTGLMLFRETASNLLINQDAMDHERGVILSEERARDTPAYRVYKQQLSFLLGDHLATRRYPIGIDDVLKVAKRDRIADFYNAYYHPDRATLIVTGDFDPAKVEDKIKAKFSDWTSTSKEGTDPVLTLPLKRGPEVKIVVEPGTAQSLDLSWISPPDLRADTRAKRRTDVIEMLGFAVMNRRLEREARSANPPFIAASAGRNDYYHSANITTLEVNVPTGKWQEGMAAAVAEERRIAQFGVTKAEMDREVEALRTSLRNRVSTMQTRKTPELADELTGTLEDGVVETNPAQDLDMFEQDVRSLTPETLNGALKVAFAGAGPLVFLGSPSAVDGGEPALKAALMQDLAAPVTAGEIQTVKTWPYDNFGAPGAVAEQSDVTDLDTVFVRFANGIHLTVKPTKFRADQILVDVRVGAGREKMPTDKITAAWAAPGAFIEGGLKDLTAEDIEQIMTSHVTGANLSVGDDSFNLVGGTNRDDLQLQMQLMTAYVASPGWRAEAFQRMKTAAATANDQQDATAGGVMGRELPKIIRSGDTRWAFPSRAEIAASKPEDVKNLLAEPLADGPIEVVIVGDTTVEKAIAAVSSTFGALPTRPAVAWTAAPAPKVTFPATGGAPVVLTHKGRADQAVGLLAYPTDDFFADMREARVLRVLGDILDSRLIDELRENQGATYSPNVQASSSSIFPHFGFVLATIDTNPEKIDGFFRDTQKIIGDIAAKPPTPDELDRAKKPAVEELQKSLQSNEFWMGQLAGAQADPRKLTAIRSAMAGIQQVTAEDVQAAAQKYLTPDKAWKLVVNPEKK
jgi:zinc protease